MDKETSRKLERMGDRIDTLARQIDQPGADLAQLKQDLHDAAFGVKKIARGQ